ncbi:MAG: hypothetical protein L6R19_16575 [Alphaproteobacteria bacterium]|nr:hypothetical protein [Alphaproteobacteria bacterium]
MAALTLVCQWRPDLLARGFASDADVVRVGADDLRIMSWNFVAIGLIFTCSGLFQAMGNTWPALAGGIARVLVLCCRWHGSPPAMACGSSSSGTSASPP